MDILKHPSIEAIQHISDNLRNKYSCYIQAKIASISYGNESNELSFILSAVHNEKNLVYTKAFYSWELMVEGYRYLMNFGIPWNN